MAFSLHFFFVSFLTLCKFELLDDSPSFVLTASFMTVLGMKYLHFRLKNIPCWGGPFFELPFVYVFCGYLFSAVFKLFEENWNCQKKKKKKGNTVFSFTLWLSCFGICGFLAYLLINTFAALFMVAQLSLIIWECF